MTLGKSKPRLALERMFGRRLLLAARATLDRVNSADRKDRQAFPTYAPVEFDADTHAQLRAYYEDADSKFTALTGHVPAWKP